MAQPDSALLTRKRETPLQWEVLLVVVLALSLALGHCCHLSFSPVRMSATSSPI